jgi:hypothetical protein
LTPEEEEQQVIDALTWRDERIAELEAENFKLAAGQCIVDKDGLQGDDYGNVYCRQQRRVKELEAEVERLKALLPDVDEALRLAEEMHSGDWLDRHIEAHAALRAYLEGKR